MREAHMPLIFLFLAFALQFQAHATPAGPLIKHFSSFLKWTRSSAKTPQSDANVLQFENGYIVETVVKGNEIGVVPYRIRVFDDGELYAVDSDSSNVVKITPPLSSYSRGRLVAGSFQGYTGHVDGKPSDARFNHPKGLTMDDKGNVYVADTMNYAIRKIGEAGVTTIAGGKSNVAGYRDGPSEDAMFSNDFDLVYVRPTCSLLVIDRGNAALRQISLNHDDCEYQYSSISLADVLMVVGAVLAGYVTCFLHQGFGSKMQPLEVEYKEEPRKEKDTFNPIIIESTREEPGWPSFGRLITDLSKLALEAMSVIFLYLVPFLSRPGHGSKKGLSPLKDTLRMPEDEAPTQTAQMQTTAVPVAETRHAHAPDTSEKLKYSDPKPVKVKSSSLKDPSLVSSRHRSKRQEHSEFYAPGEVPTSHSSRSKSQKERTKHRHRDKSAEAVYRAEGRPVEKKQADHESFKYDRYDNRNRYGSSDSFRF